MRAPLAEMDSALWLLVHPDLRRVARVRAVLDFVAERLGELRPLIEGRAEPAAWPGGASPTNQEPS